MEAWVIMAGMVVLLLILSYVERRAKELQKPKDEVEKIKDIGIQIPIKGPNRTSHTRKATHKQVKKDSTIKRELSAPSSLRKAFVLKEILQKRYDS